MFLDFFRRNSVSNRRKRRKMPQTWAEQMTAIVHGDKQEPELRSFSVQCVIHKGKKKIEPFTVDIRAATESEARRQAIVAADNYLDTVVNDEDIEAYGVEIGAVIEDLPPSAVSKPKPRVKPRVVPLKPTKSPLLLPAQYVSRAFSCPIIPLCQHEVVLPQPRQAIRLD